ARPANHEALADEVAKVILKNDPHAKEYDQLSVRVFRGYDIVIHSHWQQEDFVHTPDEWQARFPASLTLGSK
ncbi:MAG: hypothetical protein WCA11_02300, partial [Terracidiphilus sp.]